MRGTVDYRSALVMAATLSGSALAQAAPVRHSQHYWTGGEGLADRPSVVEPSQRQRGWGWLRDLQRAKIS
jgi:hypothetical protein